MTVEGISALSSKPVEIEIDGRAIVRVSEIQSTEATHFVSPSFFDTQVNGYNGSDYALDDFSVVHLKSIIDYLAASGTTQHFPTIVTRPQDKILRTLEIIDRTIRKDSDVDAAIPGIHIEGPYISGESGPRGAHDPEFVRDPDLIEWKEWVEASGNRISMVTLAPERKGAIDFIEHLSDAGTVVAIGHTAADADTLGRAVEAGAKTSTHIGNGSHSMIPRLNNYIWEQLAADGLMASFITDGFHLPPAVVNVVVRAKGLSKLILVSDVSLPAGYNPGHYKWGNIDVTVFDDGHLGVTGTDLLAGASHLLDWDLARLMDYTGIELKKALPLCTTNPASLFGLASQYGKIEPGAPANLAVFGYQKGDEKLGIQKVIREGREVYSKLSA